MKELKAIGRTLKAIRKERGMSISDLAVKCKITSDKIDKIEKGEVNMMFTLFIDLCEALQVHPRDIVSDAIKI